MAFQKGQSGNPGGRKPLPLDVVNLAREATQTAIHRLVQIVEMEPTKEILGAQVRASEVLLNRGWGTAPQTMTLLGDGLVRVKRIIIEEAKSE